MYRQTDRHTYIPKYRNTDVSTNTSIYQYTDRSINPQQNPWRSQRYTDNPFAREAICSHLSLFPGWPQNAFCSQWWGSTGLQGIAKNSQWCAVLLGCRSSPKTPNGGVPLGCSESKKNINGGVSLGCKESNKRAPNGVKNMPNPRTLP